MPNSVLWVLLVAIWLFVLVPMVIKDRPEVRKTTEATLATRVLSRGGQTMARARRRVATGRHPHDAEWTPPVREYRKPGVLINVDDDHSDVQTEVADEVTEADLDIDSGVDSVSTAEADAAPEASDVAGTEGDSPGDEIDDNVVAEVDGSARDDSDVEESDGYASDSHDGDVDDSVADDRDAADDDSDYEVVSEPLTRRGRGGYDPVADQRRSERRYRTRQRVVLALAALAIIALGVGVALGGSAWAAPGVAVVALLGYLAFLRRTVRIEERIRRQRAARAAEVARAEGRLRRESRQVVPDQIPDRLRRPGGAVVLEIDDEHPVFEHLPPFQRRRVMREDAEFSRAVGE
ncbi:gephyrin-like molybdotransferase receptor GlpR [Williamsia sp. CHRR-6]|uniref:divisome protein SepX/GlpR n=1 Tax=Williamsia sp. CHRR-6 TaxID=2835871 RepID=UPI001BDAD2DC|nr:gephyrin-like molybdotransferase receptor GlpR [Williamsia sp. CHRR-6]MBT0566615.1 hypothetical protein [Williamsia sp. CHRR-6]